MDYTALRKFWPRRRHVENPQSSDCVEEWEYNGRDDSDFYAVVWDGEGFSVIETGSTRYYGGCLLSASADETTKQAFALIVEEWRQYMAKQLLMERKETLRLRNVPEKDIDLLAQCVFGESRDRWDPIVKLLGTRKFRSEFRAKLAEQIRQWLHTPVSERRYQFPLSQRQYECIARY